MFKPVHGIRGKLASPLTTFADTMRLDSSSTTLLKRSLDQGDHTYLMVSTPSTYEIVKAVGFTGAETQIVRGQDNTTAQAFPSNTKIEFVFSEQAIEEIIQEKSLGELEIRGEGIVEVERIAVNEYVIYAPEIRLESGTGVIKVGGDFPNYVISSPELRDCCIEPESTEPDEPGE